MSNAMATETTTGTATTAPKPDLDVRPLAAVSSAHFVVDAYSNMYAPLLPLLMPKLSLGLQGAGTLMMVFQAAASLSQLLFGRLADRGHARLLLMSGPLTAAVMMSLLGYVPTTGLLAAVLVLGGLGIAAFHPPGAMVAHTTGHRKPGTAMSIFITSGTLGFAVAPLVVATTADYYGLGSTAWFLLPGVVFSLLFARTVPALPLGPVRRSGGGLAALRPQMGPLFILYVLVVLRTLVSLSFGTFVPVLLTQQGMSVSAAGAAMALYLFASGIGGFWGGTLADRFGPRRVITASLLLSTPFLLGAPQFSGWTFAVLLACGGLFLQSTLPVNVSFGQALAPHSAATVSSLMMGVAWGSGGMLVPATGKIAEIAGLPATLTGLALVPLAAAALSMRLPARPPMQLHVEMVEANVPAIDPQADLTRR
jgi:FSR family fosmidomycin resistance protein-like MFS transporter